MKRTLMAMALLLSLAIVGCGDGESGDEVDAKKATSGGMDGTDVVVDRYTVRGVVTKMPSANGGDKSLYVRHAAIPDYRNERGEEVGMVSMTMPFPIAKDLSLDDLEAGDPIEFTFTVQWEPTSRYEIIEIETLPEGTEVDFSSGDVDHEGHDH